jgi:hypothetical protein
MSNKSINIKKNSTGSHNAGSQKFENNQLSFAGFHKPGITLYISFIFKEIKIKIK